MYKYNHSKKLRIEKKNQNSEYSIYRNNEVIIKIWFLVIMPIFISKLYTSTKIGKMM